MARWVATIGPQRAKLRGALMGSPWHQDEEYDDEEYEEEEYPVEE